jgi:hypothetical protein
MKYKKIVHNKKENFLMLLLVTALMIFLISVNSSYAANNPGHDSLYIEQEGDSQLNGTFNVTRNLSVSGGMIKQGGSLTLYGDNTLPATGTFISGTSSNLYIDRVGGNIYLKYNGGETVYVGRTGALTDLNVSGALYIQGATATVGGQNICLANGSNCPSSLGGANISGAGTQNYLAKWSSSDALGSSVIYDSGTNVGIGTTSPSQKLDVNGSINISGASALLYFPDGTSMSTAATGDGDVTAVNTDDVYLSGGADTGDITIAFNETKMNLTIDARASVFSDGTGGWTNTSTETSTSLDVNVDSGTLFVNSTSNNVGIGTTSPSKKLSILNGRINIRETTASDYAVIEFGNDETDLIGGIFAAGSSAAGYGGSSSLNLVNLGSGLLTLGTDNSVHMVIKTGGNVGIGTSSPTQKLEVNGNINVSSETGKIYSPEICLAGDCQTSWPSGADGTGGWTNTSTETKTSLNVNVTGNIYYSGNLTGYGADFAEKFTKAEEVNFGDVVCLNDRMEIRRCSKRADNSVVGVVSENPTIVGNAGQKNSVPVGIVGILTTKVKGPINRFDMITTSSKLGFGEKAIKEDFGSIIGKAMEPCYKEECLIKVLVTIK